MPAMQWIGMLISSMTSCCLILIIRDRMLDPYVGPSILAVVITATIPWLLMFTHKRTIKEASALAGAMMLLASLAIVIVMPDLWIMDPWRNESDPFSCMRVLCEAVSTQRVFIFVNLFAMVLLGTIATIKLGMLAVQHLRKAKNDLSPDPD
jgi:heme/copper-type cytochrome/quinol oxidase subunit 4